LFVSTADEAGIMMNVIYNSENYCVVEYPVEHAIELVDKRSARGTFLQGDVAERFAQSMQDAVAEEASAEHIDEFLDAFDTLLDQPVVYH
jgi:transcriptional regulator of nitric oxide reductase